MSIQLLHIDNNGRVDTGYGGDRPILLTTMGNTTALLALPDRVVVAGERRWLAGDTVLAAYRR